jgi:hypothetical protein
MGSDYMGQRHAALSSVEGLPTTQETIASSGQYFRSHRIFSRSETLHLHPPAAMSRHVTYPMVPGGTAPASTALVSGTHRSTVLEQAEEATVIRKPRYLW